MFLKNATFERYLSYDPVYNVRNLWALSATTVSNAYMLLLKLSFKAQP